MELDRDSSERLNLIRFPMIIGVVFIHAYESVTHFGGTETALDPTGFWANFIRDFISVDLAHIAVPLFFFMSGFLFFYQLEWSRATYFKKVKSRLRTLLIPFLFWNLLYFSLIAVAQNLSITSTYFAGGIPHITESGVFVYFDLIIGINSHPIAFQFYFIRDLMILIALAPVFHLIHKKVPLVFLGLLFLIYLFNFWPKHDISIIPSHGPIFYFYAGSVIAIKRKTPFLTDRYGKIMLLVCLILLAIDTLFQEQSFSPLLRRMGILTGVFAAFYLSKFLLVNEKVKALFLWLGSGSFFVFAVHEPFMGFIQRVIIKFWTPNTDISKLLFYFAIPIIIIAISVCAYKLISSIFPKITAVITGGRASSPKTKVLQASPVSK